MYLCSFSIFCVETPDSQTMCPWLDENIAYKVIRYAMEMLNIYLYMSTKKLTEGLLQFPPEGINFP